MSKFQNILLYILMALLVGMLILFIQTVANAGEIGISTGPSNLAYYAVGKDIKAACPQLNINIYESKGGAANLGNLTMRSDIQVAPVPLDTLKAKMKTDPSRMSKIVAVLPLYPNAIQVVASNRSGIKTIRDLNGKRGNIGPIGSGSWNSANLVKMLCGLNYTEYTMSTSESLKKVMTGELDFAFYFSGVPTPDLQALGKDGEGLIHLVDMRDPRLEAFGYKPTEIPGDLYAWEHNTVTVQQVMNYLVAYNYGSPEKQEDIRQLAACIKDKLDWLQENGNPVWKGVDLNAEIKWPMHPMAKQVLGR